MLIDDVVVIFKAGNGGNGAATFKRNAQTARGGPDGGNGGNGGNIYLIASNNLDSLSEFRYKKSIRAEDGIKGKKQNLFGRNGTDTIIKVPLGTLATVLSTGEAFDFSENNTKTLIAKGGKGGRGNNEFKSATNQTPFYAEDGEPGEEKKIRLELRLIASIGLIGFPNAGKSSLLKALTNADPKIGDYPFTTLEPNLGVMEGIVIADIPGLIEGASSGKGLGANFLKHIEKTKLLVHCIDSQNEDVVRDYKIIRNELSSFNSSLSNEKEIVVLTKSDLSNDKSSEEKLNKLKKLNKNTHLLSIYKKDSLDKFKDILKTAVF